MSVWLAFYLAADRGDYEVEVVARPEGLAHASDLPYLSSDLSTTIAPVGADLLMELAEAGPNGIPAAEALARGRMLMLYVYHPRDVAGMLAFDVRVNDDYIAFHSPRGEHYAGVFYPTGLPGSGWLAELSAFDADTSDQVQGLIPDASLTPEIRAIVDECRERQDTEQPRYIVWFTPRGGAKDQARRALS